MQTPSAMLMLTPSSAMPLVLLAVAVLVLVGLVRPRSAAAIALGMLLVPVIQRQIPAVVATLPLWFVLLAGLVIACNVLRGMLALLLGAAGASHAMAMLFIGTLRLVGQLLTGISGGVRRLFAIGVAARERGATYEE